jgi:hypothetical protein
MGRQRFTIDQALWAKVEPTGFCWLFTGWLDPQGYGTVTWERKGQRAHRVAYQELVGPIPEGLVLDHLCRVRNCVNPDHLEPVTHKVNLYRGFTEARKHGEKTHCKNGHEYTPENTLQTEVQRFCRACARDKQKRLNSTERRAYRAEWARKDRARKKAAKIGHP